MVWGRSSQRVGARTRHLGRIASIVATFLLSLVLVVVNASPALAYTCPSGYYEQYQYTNFNDVSGIKGGVTDPFASSLPGDSSNNYYDDHIALWLDEHEETIPSGAPKCDSGLTECDFQAGVAMGSVDGTHNANLLYEPYFESWGPNGTYQESYLTGYGLNQGASIYTKAFYDGTNGYLGYPQYEAVVNGTVIGKDELYYNAVHAEAASEVYTANSDACPTLTNGSPWQNFGTDATGTVQSSEKLQLKENGSYSDWAGSTQTSHTAPYYYKQLDGTAAFRTNGPSSGPA
jgi:hypothetical protein